MISVTDAVMRHQNKAEWLFAAAVFMNDDASRQECGWLAPDQFRDEKIREYWVQVLSGIQSEKAAINTGILWKLNDYMIPGVFSSAYLQSFAETVAEDVYLCRVGEALGKLAGLVGERRLAETRQLLDELGKVQVGSRCENGQAVEASLEWLSTVDEAPDAVKTGIHKLDGNFGGFSRQALAILAARPSMGKTALATQFARACVDAGGVCLYYSVEMSRKALWSRMVCGDARVDHKLYKTRTWTGEQKELCLDVNRRLQGQYADRLVILDRTPVTSRDIWKGVAQYRPDLLVVDHLALVEDTADSNVLRIGKICWTGKELAKQYNLAALYLCQLSREVDRREVKIPVLSDLRDSGEIEQDGDTVLFIHRPDYYQDKPLTISPTNLVLAKDREGQRNVRYELWYHLVRQWFYPSIEDARAE